MERARDRPGRADAGGGGLWLRNIADAVRAFPGLFAAGGLKRRGGWGEESLSLHIGIPIYRGRDSSDFSGNLSARNLLVVNRPKPCS